MHPAILRWAPPLLGILCLALLYRIAATRPMPEWQNFAANFNLPSFQTIFLSILLDSLPFILLGVVVSAALQLLVTEQTVRRFTPRHPVAGVLFACTLGLLFPVCECGMVPIVRRLMRKGMPAYIAAVFILAGPVLNPITFASTFSAFRGQPEMAYARMGLAFAAAAATGLLLYQFAKRNPLRHTADHQGNGHHHSKNNAINSLLGHASEEFFEMGKYLILGAGITALVQTATAQETLLAVGRQTWSAQLFMAGFAYALSLCSTSDAFVAASFSPLFPKSSLLTFLVLGPMIDFKGTLMLLSIFKARFVLVLSVLTAAAVLLGSALAGQLL